MSFQNVYRTVTVLLLLWVSSALFAQQRVKIGGIVSDEQGNPVELATIRIEGTAIGTVSNLKGKYSLTFQSRDSVTVIFSMIGYQTRKRLLIKPKGNISLNMTLPPASFELGEVTVSERQRQTSTMQQINADESRLMPDASGNSIEAIIASQAGVSSTNELSYQYNVRGGSFDENMVYVNGIEIYRPLLVRSGEQEGLSFLNPDMVRSVNFSTGGYDAKYGDKMSSVLDITYKKPERNEALVNLSLLGASVYAGLSTKKLSWTNGFRYRSNKYLLGTLDTKGEYDPRFMDYQTYLNWTPSAKWEIQLIGNISENKYNFTPKDRTTRFGTLANVREFKVYFSGREKDLFRTYFGAGSIYYHFNTNNKIGLQVSAFQTNEEVTYDITGQYWLSNVDGNGTSSNGTSSNGTYGNGASGSEEETTGIGSYMEHARNYLEATVQTYSLTGSHRIAKNHIQWGVELKQEKIDDKLREWEMRDSAGYSLPHVPDGPQLIYNLASKNNIKSTRYAFFAQDTYKFQTGMGLFSLTAGIRGSYWDWNKEFLFSPRASVSLIPAANERFTLRAAAGLYYQTPFYKEFRDTVTTDGNTTVWLNEKIKSPRSIHFVLGSDYNFRLFSRPFRFTTEVYYKALSNLIPYNVDNLKITYYGHNDAKGYAAGLDMKLYGEFVPGTDSWLSFSLMKTEEKIGDKWIPRPTDQRYNLSLYFTDYFPGNTMWRMNLKAHLAGGLPFGAPHRGREAHTFRTPAYKRVDIGLFRCLLDNTEKTKTGGFARAFRSIWLGVEVFNLLDMNNVNSYYWVTDPADNQFAVPNYLTSRQINARLLIEF